MSDKPAGWVERAASRIHRIVREGMPIAEAPEQEVIARIIEAEAKTQTDEFIDRIRRELKKEAETLPDEMAKAFVASLAKYFYGD